MMCIKNTYRTNTVECEGARKMGSLVLSSPLSLVYVTWSAGECYVLYEITVDRALTPMS